MSETWKDFAKWKKPVTKDHTIHLHEMSNADKSIESESRSWLPRLRILRDSEEWLLMGNRFFYGVIKRSKMYFVAGYTTLKAIELYTLNVWSVNSI